MFAHYTQGATSGGTKWWQLGSTSAPQPLHCMDCHNAHGAPNNVLYRSPRSTPGIAKGSRAICLDCHESGSGVTVENRTPTAVPVNDRYGNPVSHHNATATQSCSSSTNECHHPHTPSCELCHGYPP
jgi:predicted CXXCH cytochrome family protein